MSDSTLFESDLLQSAERDVTTHLFSDNASGDSNLLRMDFGDQGSDWTYKPGQQPDPIKKRPQDPVKPDPGDTDNTPNIDPDKFREWVKQAEEEAEAGESDDAVDPETLEAHRKRVERLVEALLEYLLKNDRSDVHMSGFTDEFEIV